MKIKLEKIDPYRWLIPKMGDMRVPGLIFSNARMMASIEDRGVLEGANPSAPVDA